MHSKLVAAFCRQPAEGYAQQPAGGYAQQLEGLRAEGRHLRQEGARLAKEGARLAKEELERAKEMHRKTQEILRKSQRALVVQTGRSAVVKIEDIAVQQGESGVWADILQHARESNGRARVGRRGLGWKVLDLAVSVVWIVFWAVVLLEIGQILTN
jgi:hypothetical protein